MSLNETKGGSMQEAKQHVKQIVKKKVKRSLKHVRNKNDDPSPTCHISEGKNCNRYVVGNGHKCIEDI
jgi:hypothetical protein